MTRQSECANDSPPSPVTAGLIRPPPHTQVYPQEDRHQRTKEKDRKKKLFSEHCKTSLIQCSFSLYIYICYFLPVVSRETIRSHLVGRVTQRKPCLWPRVHVIPIALSLVLILHWLCGKSVFAMTRAATAFVFWYTKQSRAPCGVCFPAQRCGSVVSQSSLKSGVAQESNIAGCFDRGLL